MPWFHAACEMNDLWMLGRFGQFFVAVIGNDAAHQNMRIPFRMQYTEIAVQDCIECILVGSVQEWMCINVFQNGCCQIGFPPFM